MKKQLKLLFLTVTAVTTFAAQSMQIDFDAILPKTEVYVEQIINHPDGLQAGAQQALASLPVDAFSGKTVEQAKALLKQAAFILDLYLIDPTMGLQTLEAARSAIVLPASINNVIDEAFTFIKTHPATFTILAQQARILIGAALAQADELAARDINAINTLRDMAIQAYNDHIKALIAQHQADIDILFAQIAGMNYKQ